MSPLRTALDEYLALRRSLGFKLRLAGRLLERFVEFADNRGAEFISCELAVQWATEPADAQPAQWANRLGMVRRFAQYHLATEPRTEVPSADLLPYRYRRVTPYIYSDTEVRCLLRASATLPSALGLRAATYTTLFGLYASAGLRTNEALRLDRDDIDLAQGVLRIRGSKFGKSPSIVPHNVPWHSMPPRETVCIRGQTRRAFSSPSAAHASANGACAIPSSSSHARLGCAPPRMRTAPASMTFGTALPSIRCVTGIGPRSMWSAIYRDSQHTSATSM